MNGDPRERHVPTHSCPTRRSSDLRTHPDNSEGGVGGRWAQRRRGRQRRCIEQTWHGGNRGERRWINRRRHDRRQRGGTHRRASALIAGHAATAIGPVSTTGRSEEHTSELQSLMRISYAVFCLKKKKKIKEK